MSTARLTYYRNPVWEARDVGAEIFLIDNHSGRIEHLDQTTSALWRLLATPRTWNECSRVFSDAFPEIDAKAIQKLVDSAFRTMARRRLTIRWRGSPQHHSA